MWMMRVFWLWSMNAESIESALLLAFVVVPASQRLVCLLFALLHVVCWPMDLAQLVDLAVEWSSPDRSFRLVGCGCWCSA